MGLGHRKKMEFSEKIVVFKKCLKWAKLGPKQCEKGSHFGVPTGTRMVPRHYSAAGTGDGPGVHGAHGGPVGDPKMDHFFALFGAIFAHF